MVSTGQKLYISEMICVTVPSANLITKHLKDLTAALYCPVLIYSRRWSTTTAYTNTLQFSVNTVTKHTVYTEFYLSTSLNCFTNHCRINDFSKPRENDDLTTYLPLLHLIVTIAISNTTEDPTCKIGDLQVSWTDNFMFHTALSGYVGSRNYERANTVLYSPTGGTWRDWGCPEVTGFTCRDYGAGTTRPSRLNNIEWERPLSICACCVGVSPKPLSTSRRRAQSLYPAGSIIVSRRCVTCGSACGTASILLGV